MIAELVFAVALVVLISAMCSLMEAALYAVPFTHVENLAKRRPAIGLALRRLRRNVDQPIAAILTLNTISNTGGAALCGALAAQALGESWLIAFSVFFTLIILVLSEMIPKTAGVVYSRQVAARIARPLLVMVWAFSPFLWLTRLATRVVSREKVEKTMIEEELIIMSNLGLQQGAISKSEAAVIQNMLSLESKQAGSIMTPRTVMFSLDGNTTVYEALEQEDILAHSRIPVYLGDPDSIIGIVHLYELLSLEERDAVETQVKNIKMRTAAFVLETQTVDKLLRRFLSSDRRHMLIVIDEYGEVVGLVTLEDVLEEILGQEIVDEYDQVKDLQAVARQRRERLLQRSREAPRPSSDKRR